MKIDQMEVFRLSLPMKTPYVTGGERVEQFETVLIRLESGGISGWGEAAPGNSPALTGEWCGGVFRLTVDQLFPRIAASPILVKGEDLTKMFAPIRGNRYAKGGIDAAWHDLNARIAGKPLWKELGGTKEAVVPGLTFDRYPETERNRFFADMERVKQERFRRISMKFRPGWEIEPIRAARDIGGWKLQIQVDAEGALSFDKQADMLYRLNDFSPSLVEQPFSPADLITHTMMRESYSGKIALDEAVSTPEDAEIAADLNCAGIFCVKPGRVGGLTEAVQIRDIAQEFGVVCYAGSELTTSIGSRHLTALASLDGFDLPCDYFRFDEIFSEEPGIPIQPVLPDIPKNSEQKPLNSESFRTIPLWNEPGIGLEPNIDVIEKYAVERHRLKI